MEHQQVQIEYKHIEGCRHDGLTRWQVIVYTAATEIGKNGQHVTYKKVVDIREHPNKTVLTKYVKQMYDNVVAELDLTPAQPALF